MSKYYDDHYDAVVIGGSLAGLSCGLALVQNKFKVLVLEQHNLPGGVATSFVRGGVELEASLHEMMSIGSRKCPLVVRKILEGSRININWIRVPEAYRLVTPDIDMTLHAGIDGNFETPAKEIATYCNDVDNKLYDKLMKFFGVCLNVYNSVNELSTKKESKFKMLIHHNDFVRTLGYTALEVLNKFKFDKKVIDILSAYWIYVGSPLTDLPFTIFAYLIADYLGYGSYIPKEFSHEMSLKMAERLEKLGAQIEYGQKVEKILVENKKIKGVKLQNGTIINCDFVASGAYPNVVYKDMIEPKNEIPKEAIKFANGMELGVSCFSVVMLLDASHEDLGIKDYSTFYAPNGMNTTKMFEDGKENKNWEYITSICTNVANPDATPKGTCLYSITYLPGVEAYKDVTPLNYESYKQKQIDHFLDIESKRLGFDLRDHILEIVVETPVSISHYTGAFMGSIYGYRHSMKNHVVARLEMMKDERYIDGLTFSGTHQVSGDGMGPAIKNGRKAAMEIMEMKKNRKGVN